MRHHFIKRINEEVLGEVRRLNRALTKWTDEEVQYLQDKWEVASKKVIAKNLERSIEAIRIKAYKIGLRNVLNTADYITVCELIGALGITHHGQLYPKMKGVGFPFKNKITHKEKRVRVVMINDFWKWAKNNQDFFSFKNFIENDLGPEPSWVKDKRAKDKVSACRKTWSREDDVMLKCLVNLQKYTYEELAERFKCTTPAIKRRVYDLKLMARPLTKRAV